MNFLPFHRLIHHLFAHHLAPFLQVLKMDFCKEFIFWSCVFITPKNGLFNKNGTFIFFHFLVWGSFFNLKTNPIF